ncbi:MAG: acyltransferase [Clostridia bacterium]|nr:acyltransferase [Clostridia bacterium]
MAEVKNNRNSSIELLRIIAMFMIVISHYFFHGGVDIDSVSLGFNRVLIQWGGLGNLGVVIFVAITGYFMCTGTLKAKSLFRTAFSSWFYSYVILAVIIIVYGVPEIKSFIRALLPITLGEHWFVTVYIALMLFSPFINKLISVITRRQFAVLSCTMLILWAVVPTFTKMSFYSREFTQCLMFYLLGAYLRMYPDNFLSRKHNAVLVTVLSFALMMLSAVVCDILSQNFGIFSGGSYWYARNSVFVIAAALSLLVIFTKLNIKSKAVNTIASCTFGVYLIHDNQLLRTILWQDVLHTTDYADSPFMIVHMLVCSLIVFALCAVVEFLRKTLIEKPVLRLYDIAEPKVKSSALYNNFIMKEKK